MVCLREDREDNSMVCLIEKITPSFNGIDKGARENETGNQSSLSQSPLRFITVLCRQGLVSSVDRA